MSWLSTELDALEYTNGTGSSTAWTKDVVGASQNDTSSTTVTFPSLTPSGSGELYVGFGRNTNTATGGTTTGFTFDTSSNGIPYIYDPSVSAVVSPTGERTASAGIGRFWQMPAAPSGT